MVVGVLRRWYVNGATRFQSSWGLLDRRDGERIRLIQVHALRGRCSGCVWVGQTLLVNIKTGPLGIVKRFCLTCLGEAGNETALLNLMLEAVVKWGYGSGDSGMGPCTGVCTSPLAE